MAVTEKLHALRTAAAWTTNQTAMEALYGVGNYYTAMSSWESAQDRDLTATGDGEIAILECYNDWPTGLSDNLTINGWTTDATRYIEIRTPESERHDGTPESGFWMTSAVNTLTSREHIKLIGLDIHSTEASTGTVLYIGPYEAITATVDSCIVHGESSCYTGFAIGAHASTVNVRNTLFTKAARNGVAAGSTATTTLYNCVIADNNTSDNEYRQGISSGATTTMTNTVAYNNNREDFDGTAATLTTCASSDSTAYGTGAITGIVSGDFNAAASEDYHLSGASSALYDVGTDLSTTFTTDIDGDTWADWSIGFDQISGGTPTTTVGKLINAGLVNAGLTNSRLI